MFNAEQLQEKWAPILNHDGLGEIKDPHKRMVTSVLLENQEKMIKEEQEFLGEAAPTNSTGSSISNFDPVLISLIRRSMPNLVAYDPGWRSTNEWSYRTHFCNALSLRYSERRRGILQRSRYRILWSE